MGLEAKAPKTVEERVRDLETYVKVVAAVAVIFGISGAWGLNALSNAKKQLDDLKEGVVAVQHERDRAVAQLEQSKNDDLEDLTKAKAAQLADIQANAIPLVKGAITQEMTQQIGASKKWTAFVFATATQSGLPASGANGWWQKALIDQNALVQSELK